MPLLKKLLWNKEEKEPVKRRRELVKRGILVWTTREDLACSHGIIIEGHEMLHEAQGNPEIVANHDYLVSNGSFERLLSFGVLDLNFLHDLIGNNLSGTHNRLALGFIKGVQQMS